MLNNQLTKISLTFHCLEKYCHSFHIILSFVLLNNSFPWISESLFKCTRFALSTLTSPVLKYINKWIFKCTFSIFWDLFTYESISLSRARKQFLEKCMHVCWGKRWVLDGIIHKGKPVELMCEEQKCNHDSYWFAIGPLFWKAVFKSMPPHPWQLTSNCSDH